jgi:peptidyl-prolyl cis-trans isomerase SurA
MKQIQLIIFLLGFNNFFGQEKPILIVDNDEVFKSEFEQIYWKNKKEKIATKEDLNDYIKLFVNFKLKVKAAEAIGLDTTKKFKDELSGYRYQLEKPYLIDTSINEDLINEAYYRTVNEINASHIMVKLGPNPTPKDTLLAFNRIKKLRSNINSGLSSFEELAQEVSEDPSAKFNKGNLGFFNAFKMLYSFECAAYQTPIGKISNIVRTKYGYHIVKPNELRKAKGKMRTSHIMITVNPKTKDEKPVLDKINSIYYELQSKNKTFEELANEYSEDRKSAKKGGEIGWVSSAGNFYPEFEEKVFSLKNDGEYSKPFKTPNGWHIVKRLEFEPVADLSSLRYELKNKIQKDSRAQKTRASFIKNLKVEYNLEDKFNAKELKNFIAKRKITQENYKEFTKFKYLEERVLYFSSLSYSNNDFINFLVKGNTFTKSKESLDLMKIQYNKFIDQKLIAFEKTQLERKHPDFKALMKEYRDGILLFEISDQKIWSKAIQDTSGLKKHFTKNRTLWKFPNRANGTVFSSESKKTIMKAYKLKAKRNLSNDSLLSLLNKEDPLNISCKNKVIEEFKNYNTTFNNLIKGVNQPTNLNNKWFLLVIDEKLDKRTKEFNEAEGIIVSSYQNFLENAWLKDLKEKYTVEINYDILESIKDKP